MAEPLTVVLNGTEKSFADLGEAPTVAALVDSLGFRADRVALELNGDIVARTDWAATPLTSGSRVELVHFVGGGCH